MNNDQIFTELTEKLSNFRIFLNFYLFLIFYVIYVSLFLNNGNSTLFHSFELKEVIFVLTLSILTVSMILSYFEVNGLFVLVFFFFSEILLLEFNILYLNFNLDFSLLANLFSIGVFLFYLNIQVKKKFSILFFFLSCFVYIALEIINNNFDSNIIIFLFLLICILFFLANIYEEKYLSNFKQIEEKNKELAELMKQNNMFLSKMSHNIRTPLNIVKEKIFDSDPQCIMNTSMGRCSFIDNEIIKEISNLNTTANQLLLTVNEILDYEKTLSGKNTIKLVRFDINQLFGTINDIFDPLIKQKKLSFSIIKHNEKLENIAFFGNVNHLKQILMNLIDNAIKYTIEGDIKLIVDLKEMIDRTFLEIEITDTGIGIPTENVKDLFKPFSQIKNSLDVTGSGLGLAITHDLIELNNGKIFIESVVNEGTSFKIEFPIEIETIYKMEKPKADWQTDINVIDTKFRKTIEVLLADDYQENHFLIKELLKKQPINIEFVLDGQEALEKLSTKKYDIIFLDIRMPKKNGMETIVEAKSLDHNPNLTTPYIALTANYLKEEITFYKKIGFKNVVTKPFSRNDLIQAIYSNLDYTFLKIMN